MGASPVDAVAFGAFHVLLLSFKNVRWYPVFYLLFAYLPQGLVAFKADAERSALEFHIEGFYHLANLVLGFVSLNEDSFEPSAGYHPSFHNLRVSGQYHAFLSQGYGYHICVIKAVEENGVISHQPQPFDQLPYVVVYDEFKLANGIPSMIPFVSPLPHIMVDVFNIIMGVPGICHCSTKRQGAKSKVSFIASSSQEGRGNLVTNSKGKIKNSKN